MDFAIDYFNARGIRKVKTFTTAKAAQVWLNRNGGVLTLIAFTRDLSRALDVLEGGR